MTHPHGSFCFAELHTSDMQRDKRFYGELLGWTAVDVPSSDGSYALFQLNGRNVAGLRQARGHRRWIPFLSVANADDAATRAHKLGAALVAVPFEMSGFARLALLNDPAGGVVGLWEAKGHQGAEVLDDPGTMWWAELVTRDVLVAKNFYGALLGWKAVDTLKYGIRYSVFKQGEQSIAGLLPIGSDWGPVTPYWQVLFAVDNCDARIERAKALGGSVVFGPNDVPNAGRAAILGDPGNAIFVLMQPKEVNHENAKDTKNAKHG